MQASFAALHKYIGMRDLRATQAVTEKWLWVFSWRRLSYWRRFARWVS